MKTIEEIIEKLPENIRLPIYEAFQVLQKDIIHRDLQEIRDEIKKVWEAIGELTQAQKRAEQRITRLEKVVEELAQAQKRTEEELKKLIGEHKKTREQLGGLSHAFAYVLEDRAIRSLPKILKKNYRIEVIGNLKREYLVIKGEYIEVNIYGKAKKNGKRYDLIGEAKSKISKKIIDNFIKKCDKISEKSIKVIVSYIFTPEVKKYAESKGVILIPSYELGF